MLAVQVCCAGITSPVVLTTVAALRLTSRERFVQVVRPPNDCECMWALNASHCVACPRQALRRRTCVVEAPWFRCCWRPSEGVRSRSRWRECCLLQVSASSKAHDQASVRSCTCTCDRWRNVSSEQACCEVGHCTSVSLHANDTDAPLRWSRRDPQAFACFALWLTTVPQA